MRTFIFFFLFIFIIGCTSRGPLRQNIYRSYQTTLEELTQDDLNLFESNWKLAEELLVQDKMAWIATDAVVPTLNAYEWKLLRGYVISGNLQNGEVSFFNQNVENKNIRNVITASFKNGKISNISKFNEMSSIILKVAKCIQKAKDINMDYIIEQGVSYNTYSIIKDKEIIIYLAPGSNNKYFVFAGGIITKFNEELDIIENKKLHHSIVAYELDELPDILGRTSSLSSVPNEIDLMQYLVFKDIIYNQMIMTEKYAFLFNYVPDENRIIKSVKKASDVQKLDANEKNK